MCERRWNDCSRPFSVSLQWAEHSGVLGKKNKKWGESFKVIGANSGRWARVRQKIEIFRYFAAAESWFRMMVREKSSADILGLNVKWKRTDAGWADRRGEHRLLDQVTLAITFLLREFVPDDHKCRLSLCGRGEASRKEDARPGKYAQKQAAWV